MRDGHTGLVVSPTPRALCDGMERLTSDPVFYARVQDEARHWSATFSFDDSAAAARSVIAAAVERAPSSHGTPARDARR